MRQLVHAISVAGMVGAGSTGFAAGQELPAASQALVDANAAMHTAMAVEMTGDVDVDFMRTMIPHHEGAVEMARIVIENGKDPEVRKLAEDIIKAQETEIAMMKAWLEQNGAGEGGAETGDHGAH